MLKPSQIVECLVVFELREVGSRVVELPECSREAAPELTQFGGVTLPGVD